MEICRLLVLNTLRENWLLSFSSTPPGEITERAAGCEKPFFNTLLMRIHRGVVKPGDFHSSDSLVSQTDPLRGSARKVDSASADIGTAIVYSYCHRAAVRDVGYPDHCAQGQGFGSGRQAVLPKYLTVRGAMPAEPRTVP
jgi:hypothetical protein